MKKRSSLLDTPAGWITFGYGGDLTDAAYMALGHMVRFMEKKYGFHKREALAMASLLVDLNVTQVVNGVRASTRSFRTKASKAAGGIKWHRLE